MQYKGLHSEHRFVFVHVPKTAGRSVYSSLLSSLDPELEVDFGHVPSVVYQNKFKEEYNNFFKFGFVRNPWDRLVSAFFYILNQNLRRAGKGAEEAKWLPVFGQTAIEREGKNQFNEEAIISWKDKDFETFVKRDLLKFWCFTHVRPQVFWLCNDEGQVNVDFVGRYENLHKDFDLVCNKLGVHDVELGFSHKEESRVQNGAVKPYWEYYDDEMIDIVSRLFSQDIETFGYNFR